MKIKIVTDSASNMYSMEGVAFEPVPLKIITNEKEYVDTATLDVQRMVDELSIYKGRSGTACPGVGDWLAAFEGYDVIYCVTIISTLSGSYNAAMTAKQQYEEENPGKKVFVNFILRDEHLALPQEVRLCFKAAFGILHSVQNAFDTVPVVRCDAKAHDFWVFLVRL